MGDAHMRHLDSRGETRSRTCKLVLCLSAVGVGHFLVSGVGWALAILVAAKSEGSDWPYIVRHIISLVFLLGLFLGALLVAWRAQKYALVPFVAAVLCTIALFLHDVWQHDYQIGVTREDGCKHIYITWWWYDDSWDPNR